MAFSPCIPVLAKYLIGEFFYDTEVREAVNIINMGRINIRTSFGH
jgi:hypothetical protein